MYKVKGSVWIEGDKGAFIGMGRVMLLEKTKELGSITVAAKSMKMSYRHAWELIDSMNKQARLPLFVTSSGGVGGGGTKIKNEGERVVALFRDLQKRFHKFNEEESKKIKL